VRGLLASLLWRHLFYQPWLSLQRELVVVLPPHLPPFSQSPMLELQGLHPLILQPSQCQL